MTEADLETVAAIGEASFGAANWGPAAYRAILLDPLKGLVLVAATPWAPADSPASAVAGFVCVRITGNEAEILNLAVQPSQRRCGIGAQLLHAALDFAATCRARKVFLEVRESNDAALRLYQRFGFRLGGRRSGYYRDPAEDAIILARLLDWSGS